MLHSHVRVGVGVQHVLLVTAGCQIAPLCITIIISLPSSLRAGGDCVHVRTTHGSLRSLYV